MGNQTFGLHDGRPPWRRIRVLCLSGHASRSEVTQVQAMHLQLEEKHGMELSFLDGPFETPEPYDPSLRHGLVGPFHTWATVENGKYRDREQLRAGVDHVLTHVAQQGPFDGLYGFSMGALIATLASERLERIYSATLRQEEPRNRWRGFTCFHRKPDPWNFVIAGCGSFLDSDIEEVSPPLIKIFSLHLVGAQDYIRNQSIELSTRYAGAITHEMEYAGHAIPAACLSDAGITQNLTQLIERACVSSRTSCSTST